MVFEAAQFTCATGEVPVFCGLLVDGGQRATMLDRHVGRAFPSLRNSTRGTPAHRRHVSSGSLAFLEGSVSAGHTTEVR